MASHRTVLVAGFFDLLHSGHIRFLEEASKFGEVVVSLGSDANSVASKGKEPIYSEEERKYMLESIQYVSQVEIAKNTGPLSFEEHLKLFNPDFFIINSDGHSDEKQACCKNYDVAYKVLQRFPKHNFSPRSSSALRELDLIPHRMDLAGGFFDQKKINGSVPGAAIICNIEPKKLADRAGMSSSTRRVIRELFGNRLPTNHSEQELANIILAYENFDQDCISGATDAYGLVFSSVCRFRFHDSYRPHAIEKIHNAEILNWLEQHLFLYFTHARPKGYQVFDGRESFPEDVLREYSLTSDNTWDAIQDRDLEKLIECVNRTCKIQKKLIPGYISVSVSAELAELNSNGMGAKLMGAGGTGYIMVVAQEQPPGTQRVTIRRESLNL